MLYKNGIKEKRKYTRCDNRVGEVEPSSWIAISSSVVLLVRRNALVLPEKERKKKREKEKERDDGEKGEGRDRRIEWTRICFLRDYTSFQTGDHAPTRYF